MLTLTRIRTDKLDGWDATLNGQRLAHDCSKFCLIRYCHALGHIEVGDQFRVIRDQYLDEHAIDRVQTLTESMVEDLG